MNISACCECTSDKAGFFSNKKYDSYKCWTCASWEVMYIDSNSTFLSWLDWLGVAPAFRISILKFFKSIPNYWHRVTDMTSFERYLESCSDHTMTFYLNFVSRICFGRNLSRRLLRWSSLQTKQGQKRSKFRLVGLLNSHAPSTSRVWPSNHRGACPFHSLYISFLKHCTLSNKAVGTIWRDLSKPPNRRQGTDPRPLWLLVFGPKLASRRAEHSLLWRMSLYYMYINYLIYCFYHINKHTS